MFYILNKQNKHFICGVYYNHIDCVRLLAVLGIFRKDVIIIHFNCG